MDDALAKLLAQVLRERRLSFRKAAMLCGLDGSALSTIVYGKSKRPAPETLHAISEGLGISYRTLALAAYGYLDTGAQVASSEEDPQNGTTVEPPPAPAEGESAWPRRAKSRPTSAVIS